MKRMIGMTSQQLKQYNGLIEKVTQTEMAIAIKAMKTGKAAGPYEVCVEMILAFG